MSCPSCHHTLEKIPVTTDGGGKFDIEHCRYCGGTWFDPYEINRIPYHEVLRIADKTVNPKIPSYSVTRLFCPNDHGTLTPFESEVTPSGISLLRCPTCHGIWATQRALDEFKRFQLETINEYKSSGKAFPSLSVVFVPVLSVALLLTATFLTLLSLSTRRDEQIRAERLISDISLRMVSDTSLILLFRTTEPLRSTIAYGETDAMSNRRVITTEFTTDHSVMLSQLGEGTRYWYRLILEDQEGNVRETEPEIFRLPALK